MSVNFAPYSDPPTASSSKLPSSKSKNWFSQSSSNSTSYQSGAGVDDLDHTHASSSSSGKGYAQDYSHGEAGGVKAAESWDTRYGWRCDLAAAVCYAFGPILAIILLILETTNDYVRFHAYQSLLYCSLLGALHLLLIWSRFLTTVLVLIDIASLAYLTWRAYTDGESLTRFELPRIGELASSWVEAE